MSSTFNCYEFIRNQIVKTYVETTSSLNNRNPNAHIFIKQLRQKGICLPKIQGGDSIDFVEFVCLAQQNFSKQFEQEESKQFYTFKDEKMRIQIVNLPQQIQNILKYTKNQVCFNRLQSIQQFRRQPLKIGNAGKVYTCCYVKGKRISLVMSFDRLIGKVLIDRQLINQGKQRSKIKNQKMKIKKNNYLRKLIQQEIKMQYKMNFNNLLIGSTYESQGQSKFLPYFATDQIQSNIEKNYYKKIRIENYLWLRKPTGNSTKHSIELISLLFNRKAMKVEFNLQEVEQVIVFRNQSFGGSIYFKLKINPKYYLNIMEPEYAFAPYNISQWHRVQNFPLFYTQNAQEQLLKIYIRNSTTFCINVNDGKYQFQQFLNKLERIRGQEQVFVFKYRQEIQNLTKVKESSQLKLLFDSKIFLKSLKAVALQKQGSVFQIKFALASLLESKAVTYQQIIEVLHYLQKHSDEIQNFQQILVNVSHINLNGRHNQLLNFIQNELYKNQDKQESSLDSASTKKNIGNKGVINTHVKIANLKVTPSGIKFSQHTTEQRNRVLKQFAGFEHQFLKIQVVDDNDYRISSSEYLSSNFIRKLINRVNILDRTYIPLAWSQSQLRGCSMWYMCQDLEGKHITRQQVLQFLGDFNGIMNPALRAARIGQNMAAAWSFNAIGINCRVQKDIYPLGQKKLMYTDGIGRISQDLIMQIQEQKECSDLCAIQVRYKGAKGVLVIDPRLGQRTIVLRESMVKFTSQHPDSLKYLDILQENKYKVGYLNREIIILLHSRGVKDEVFLKLQEQYIKQIQQIDQENKQQHDYFNKGIQNYFTFSKKQSIKEVFMAASKLSDVTSLNQPYFHGIVQAIKERSLELLKSKAHIKVRKSARLLGVIDQLGLLRENQVYCSIKKRADRDKQNIKGLVCLTKNPCMLKGDVRVVKCVSDKELYQRSKQKGLTNYISQYFVNVVVFPQAGKKPLTSLISGSDLDGDQFFICWHPEFTQLLSLQNSQQNRTQQEMNPQQRRLNHEPTYNDILDFFVEFVNSDSLGKLSNSHLVHADQNLGSVDCVQCCKLAEIHGVAVDYPKKGFLFNVPKELLVRHYPHYMEKTYPTKSYQSESILGKLYDACNLMNNSEHYNIMNQNTQLIRQFELQNYDYQFQEVDWARKTIKQYHDQISGILEYFKLSNEFQVYIGKHINEKNARTVQVVTHLKTTYIQKFFSKLPDHKKHKKQFENITLSDLKNHKQPKMHYQVQRKLVLWYTVSHLLERGGKVPIFNQNKKSPFYYVNALSDKKQKAHCLGVTWFCLPKLMVWLFKSKVAKNSQSLRKKIFGRFSFD